MSAAIHAVTVYCSSSSAVPRIYTEAAAELGRAIASRGWKLIYGGNNVGVMGVLADAVRSARGKVVGITPRLFVDKGLADNHCEELIICDSMRQRKEMMENRGDAFIAMPGGLGTLEELFEIIVGKQLRCHAKPIVLLNSGDYFAPLVALLEHGIEQHFIKPSARELFHLAKTPADALAYLDAYRPPDVPDKWFSAAAASSVQ